MKNPYNLNWMSFAVVFYAVTFAPVTSAADEAAMQTAPQNKWLSPAQVAEDIKLIEGSFELIHPGYTRYTSAESLRQQWQSIIELANQNEGARLGDFYKDVQRVMSSIRCDHTKVEVPERIKTERKTMPAYFPFRWKIIQQSAVVEFAMQNSTLQRGDEILSIDDHSIEYIVTELSPFVPVDGFNDHTRSQEIAFSSEFLGGVYEHFTALQEAPKASSEIVFVRDGQTRTVVVDKVGFTQWRQFLNAEQPFYRNFKDEISLDWLDEHTAKLNVNTFVNYRTPVDPKTLFDPIFAELKQKGTKHLILDLRQNEGGSSEVPASLFSYLIDEPDSISRDVRVKTYEFGEYKSLLKTWDKNALDPDPAWFEKTDEGDFRLNPALTVLVQTVQPSKMAFNGELVVLTSMQNSSGSTNLLSKLQDLKRATFIGEATGGNSEGSTAGVIFFVTLPNSEIIARLPAQRGYNNVSNFVEGRGIIPDIEVKQTLSDWQADKDKILETAIAHIKSN